LAIVPAFRPVALGAAYCAEGETQYFFVLLRDPVSKVSQKKVKKKNPPAGRKGGETRETAKTRLREWAALSRGGEGRLPGQGGGPNRGRGQKTGERRPFAIPPGTKNAQNLPVFAGS